MNKRTFRCIAPTGLLLSAVALIVSTLLGFGGFSMQAFSCYVITGYVSNLQMVFLILAGLGLILSGVAYVNQAKKQKIKGVFEGSVNNYQVEITIQATITSKPN